MRERSRQSGVTLMEFALSFMIFWLFLMGIVEFSRLMMAWGTASEATRLAARLASTCEMSSAQLSHIRQKVLFFIQASGQFDPGTSTNWLVVNYYPAGCTADSCITVEAKLQNLTTQLLLPVPGLPGITLPEYRTRVLRESMRNVIATDSNSACQ